ncbi:MAG: hypothetical protein SWH61_08130 [Thermodesulfobacteriota bacterium]|nr:hypothetical protein [Thermodesulfobacteriota bacterium]
MRLEQLEYFLPEQRHQVISNRLMAHLKLPLPVKAAVRGDNVQVRVEVLEVPKGLHRTTPPGTASSQETEWPRYLPRIFQAHLDSPANNFLSCENQGRRRLGMENTLWR